VGQAPDWSGLEQFQPLAGRAHIGNLEAEDLLVLRGGDVLEPAIAGFAIAQGRRAAEAMHAKLRGCSNAPKPRLEPFVMATVKAQDYAPKERVHAHRQPVAERLARPDVEAEQTLGEQAFLAEAERCLSCGSCNGCQRCFMYCTPGAFRRLERPQLGAYYALSLDTCEGCGKCVDLCPTGFLTCVPAPRYRPGSSIVPAAVQLHTAGCELRSGIGPFAHVRTP
jgi:ferredoxin